MGTTRKSKRTIVLAAIPACVLVAGVAFYSHNGSNETVSTQNYSSYSVTRGDLVMSVTESGTIKARNSVQVQSEVEGETTIVSIVPEGTVITQEDVDKGLVIVSLDSSQLTDKVNQQEIDYNSAEADLTEARESLDIQVNQNDSDLQKGLMTLKFGLMDLQKYLGETTAIKAVKMYDPNEQTKFDVSDLIKDPNQIGGASLQQLRELESSIGLAEQELKQAIIDLDWTKKLYEKQYESRSELETAQLMADRLKIKYEQAKTALDLFIRYEFPKEAERLFSEYLEAERQLERTKAQARSKLAQAQARLKSTEAKYLLSKERLDKFRQQIKACTIKATAPGLVIYAGNNNRFSGSRTNIEVGEDIREREMIMTITDAIDKDVDVKVHETNIDKIRISQPVRIVVDAIPDKVFFGSVRKISLLPDPTSFFGNPDLKVYTTEVSIEDVPAEIKPGMSARVEILIAELQDVLSIPVQSVANRDGKKVCYLVDASGSKETVIETGAFNDRFIQVKNGLTEGQRVLLNPPRLVADEKTRKNMSAVAKSKQPQGDQTAEDVVEEEAQAIPASLENSQMSPELDSGAIENGVSPAGDRPRRIMQEQNRGAMPDGRAPRQGRPRSEGQDNSDSPEIRRPARLGQAQGE